MLGLLLFCHISALVFAAQHVSIWIPPGSNNCASGELLSLYSAAPISSTCSNSCVSVPNKGMQVGIECAAHNDPPTKSNYVRLRMAVGSSCSSTLKWTQSTFAVPNECVPLSAFSMGGATRSAALDSFVTLSVAKQTTAPKGLMFACDSNEAVTVRLYSDATCASMISSSAAPPTSCAKASSGGGVQQVMVDCTLGSEGNIVMNHWQILVGALGGIFILGVIFFAFIVWRRRRHAAVNAPVVPDVSNTSDLHQAEVVDENDF